MEKFGFKKKTMKLIILNEKSRLKNNILSIRFSNFLQYTEYMDYGDIYSLFTFKHWRGKWQPTPVFLPGESQGQRSLVGCRLWGCIELDTTEVT